MGAEPILPPNPERMRSIQALCELDSPFQITQDEKKLFTQAIRESMEWHSERQPFYRKYLKERGFQISEIHKFSDCSKIPFLSAQLLKRHELLSVPLQEIVLHCTSSGTHGEKSQIFFDSWSLHAGSGMVRKIFQHYRWTTPSQKVNYLLYTYEPDLSSQLGSTYTDQSLTQYAPIENCFYALKRTGLGTHEFDLFGSIQCLQEYARQGLPVRIFGFPSFFHFTLKRMHDLKLPPLQFSQDSLVFLGGGWKGHTDQMIPKLQFYSQITHQLGIPDHRIRDGFGAVEHGVPYIECEYHSFHIPVWSQVWIRDLQTLQPLPYDQPGLLQFVTPYITSIPTHSLLMGDLATLHPGSSCSCPLQTDYFKILGRAGTSKNRSCAISAAELLRDKK